MSGNKKLQKLTPEEQSIFDSRRESDAVIQTKCVGCGAWYETGKRFYTFEESFPCDCGLEIKFTVPAMETGKKLIKPSNEAVLSVMDRDARLDTGMTLKEAMRRASEWWEAKGRKQMQRELQRQATPVGGADRGAGGAFASQDSTDPNFLPSGIIQGMQWEALGKRERLMIVKAWHHFMVRNPDLIGEDDRITHKMQDRGKIQ